MRVTKREGRVRYDRLDMFFSQPITRNEEDLKEKKSQREMTEKEIFIEEEEKKRKKNNSKLYGLMEVFFQLIISDKKEDANNRTV
jgi:hypothetical protein